MSLKAFKMNSLRNKPKQIKTFKSYIDIGIREQKENSTPNSFQAPIEEISLSPTLLPGEGVVTHAEHVLRYNTHSERKTGISGALFCTNFKLAFVTTEQFPSNLHLHNLVLGENDICLLNIQSINHGGRKKRISLQPNSTPSGEEILEVRCKDFKIYQFSFKFTPEGQAKQLVKALTYHTFVDYIQRLFFFDYPPPPTSPSVAGKKLTPPLFTTPQDWQLELVRCGLSHGWRISQANENYQLCDSLPRSMVVPSSILDALLFQAAPYFVGRRVPVWTWGLKSGASLVRMSLPDPAVTDEEQITKMVVESLAHSGEVHLSDLSRDLPSVAEVAESFSKLQDLCTPNSTQKFWEQDRHFFVRLEDSHWLTYVSRCLRRSLELAKLMVQNTSVVLMEAGSRDLSCVVASLIQLLLDPQCRTQKGFELLLDKEWLALGHPFTDRLGHLDEGGKESSSPILLLFLDCVWQLTRQCPASMQFTETYLTCVWDTAHLTLVDTFLFNCHAARESLLTRTSTHWDWDLQFSHQNQALFCNPLYVLTKFQQASSSSVRWEDPEDLLFSLDPEVRSLELWSQCYLRWIPAAQVIGGGDGVTYLWLRKLAEEVEALCKQLEQRKPHRRIPSDDYLFTTELDSLELRPHNIVMTSAFPFSPLGPWDVRNYVAVPSSSYLHISLPTDYEDD